MIGVVLLGVLFDRPALTMRTLTIAALVVLLFAPESIVHPSFQMSFAATLALIAGYERGAIKLRGRADTSLGARAALWGVNEIVGLTIASLLAGLATTPYAAFYFHRIAPYGVIANLLAMPIANGSQPMPTAATRTIKAWGRASLAMRPAALANSPVAAWSPTRSARSLSKKTASAPPSLLQAAGKRRRIARQPSSIAACGGNAVRSS